MYWISKNESWSQVLTFYVHFITIISIILIVWFGRRKHGSRPKVVSMLSLYAVHEERHILKLLINADDKGFKSTRYSCRLNPCNPIRQLFSDQQHARGDNSQPSLVICGWNGADETRWKVKVSRSAACPLSCRKCNHRDILLNTGPSTLEQRIGFMIMRSVNCSKFNSYLFAC